MSKPDHVTIRIELDRKGKLADVTEAISKLGGTIVGIDPVSVDGNKTIRDITLNVEAEDTLHSIHQALQKIHCLTIVSESDRTFLIHLGGKIEIKSKISIKTRDDLSMAYTPGVARVCTAIYKEPEKAYNLTIKRNMVAVVSDGSAVLGLGNIGPKAAMPVMEGKAMLFKDFGGVDAFPICLDTQDTDEIINTVKNIAPGFGGINLEDIAAPRCFEIEKRLKEELDIPVFHDDQHGTAIVLAAGFINALKLTKKKAEDLKIVFSGVGAAGVACTEILQELGVKNIIGCDRKGAIYKGRDGLDDVKTCYAESTNPNGEKGSLKDVIKGADVFVGLSAPNVLDVEDLKNMNKDPIIFAMANPTPEIMPEIAKPHVAIMATGRSDYPNQINNVLAFPGIFRGALACRASDINEAMKIAAAKAIAGCIDDAALSPDYIVPSVFDKNVVPSVEKAVINAAIESGVARKEY